MSMSLGLSGLEKASIPTSGRFPPASLPQLSPRFPPMDARLVAAARLPGLPMYGSPYNTPNFPGYLPYPPSAAAVAAATAADPSAFYPPLGPGENVDSWRASLSQAAAYYDPTMVAHYGYGYGAMGLSDGARRKNATRETTSTLKAWLNEHRKNPYPTKGEKIMLAIITKMTLTQVSTWFANARRRLKKENKMTWSPRNRVGEDDDDDDELDDVNLNENPANRLSPLTPDLVPNTHVTTQAMDRSYNDHGGGIENSNEVFNFAKKDNSRSVVKNTKLDTHESGRSPHTERHHISIEEPRPTLSSSVLSRQHIQQSETSSLSSSQITPPITPGIPRQNVPFPPTLPQLSVVPPHPNMIHPGLQEQMNQSPSLSRFSPHIMAALLEQAHQFQYQHALQGLPMNNFLNPSVETTNTSPSVTTSGSDNFTSMVSGRGSGSPSSSKPSSPPNKSKIWSIADVAMSSDSSRRSNHDENLEHLASKSNPTDLPQARLWMDLLQQKIAATMSGSIDPQQLPQLSNGMSPHLSNSILPPPARFPNFHSFPTGLMGAPESVKPAAPKTERKSLGSPERTSLSPQSHCSDEKDSSVSEKAAKKLSSSNSCHDDSLHEINEAKQN